jgi:hypothetical protein
MRQTYRQHWGRAVKGRKHLDIIYLWNLSVIAAIDAESVISGADPIQFLDIHIFSLIIYDG